MDNEVLDRVSLRLATHLGVMPLEVMRGGDCPVVTFGVSDERELSVEDEDELRWALEGYELSFKKVSAVNFDERLRKIYRVHDAWIKNCQALIKSCPKKWEKLKLTSEESIRFCDQCSKEVTLVTSNEELDACQALGKCVAIASFEDFSNVIAMEIIASPDDES